MVFLGIAAALVLGSLALVLAPLLRGSDRLARRASHDMQVFRDQLREIDADRARGILSAEEAEATRIEVSRRLLAAADAEGAEASAGPAPRGLSRAAALAALVLAGAGAGAAYLQLGAPGMPDRPLRERQAQIAAIEAERDDGAALIAQLQKVLEDRPDDLQGHRLLVTSLAGMGRMAEAVDAQRRVIGIQGEAVPGHELVSLAGLMIAAEDGRISPEAEAALAAGLAKDPEDPSGRYFSGLLFLQNGQPERAYPIWSRLLEEGPPDAPWVKAIAPVIEGLAAEAGRPPPAPARGPGAAEVEAAGAMPAGERQAMIEGMVDRLAERLATEGGPPEDWAQLIRSLGVLGRADEAGRIRDEAGEAFAGDPAALAQIAAAARDAGLAP
ncbi:MAG TPA: c-type cytochrome biogenesis protein CcmI [Amaricoccus sp.]|uniref:c-type cytochrome biogenesis protein CcmI n=1 Tax=Amaricoccus sp. TaxID=1872485 RepID=UPI002BFC6606|nr:c-type cytochrome biogenesis protein CcmI [Amaricoccus sp.]HMQ94368.1 c-type cytochrome biogenesis protein CcmI [Amaricoccus sp.]HMR54632.1 c-type cytochrome biogenesis protein CcmI [Amaricoccus sp.]HMR62068.1 c-type cytochrome biogenesis protein CcmI [Amaricoccus sp.]HMU01675.1 c-type cytochrome biogenesis protein CcmI [Amaricoccus sp.]